MPLPVDRVRVLDVRSRQSVREFLIQGGIGLAIMIALFAAGSQTWHDLAHAAVRVFRFYGFIDSVRALFGREPLGRGSLSRWDQAAAYFGFAELFEVFL